MGVQKGFLRGHPDYKPPTPLITRRKLLNAKPLVGKTLLCPPTHGPFDLTLSFTTSIL